MLQTLRQNGIAVLAGAMLPDEVDALAVHLAPLVGGGAGDRTLHNDPVVKQLATIGPLGRLAKQVLGKAYVARILYFDKHPEANWKVPYHQDLVIAVRDRKEVEGYSGWSQKGGLTHVRAPSEILEQMVAIRLHLDDCGPDNGPLRAIPGSHVNGVLLESLPISMEDEQAYICAKGDVIFMRPLILHASAPAASPTRRRVLHVEYAGCMLPCPLEWALGFPVP